MRPSLNCFLVIKKQFKSRAQLIDQHRFHGHPFLRMDEDATASMGMAINPLWCRTALILLKVMNIAQAASMGVLKRGNARSPEFPGVLRRVTAKGPAVA